jgi:hypothetical protein
MRGLLSFYPFPFSLLVNLCFFLIGAGLASFFQCMIYRVDRSIDPFRRRSFCDACGCPVRWYGLVPFFGYFIVKGRCGSCGDRIDPRYPAVELLGGVVSVLLANSMMTLPLFVPYLPSVLFLSVRDSSDDRKNTTGTNVDDERLQTGKRARGNHMIGRAIALCILCLSASMPVFFSDGSASVMTIGAIPIAAILIGAIGTAFAAAVFRSRVVSIVLFCVVHTAVLNLAVFAVSTVAALAAVFISWGWLSVAHRGRRSIREVPIVFILALSYALAFAFA